MEIIGGSNAVIEMYISSAVQMDNLLLSQRGSANVARYEKCMLTKCSLFLYTGPQELELLLVEVDLAFCGGSLAWIFSFLQLASIGYFVMETIDENRTYFRSGYCFFMMDPSIAVGAIFVIVAILVSMKIAIFLVWMYSALVLTAVKSSSSHSLKREFLWQLLWCNEHRMTDFNSVQFWELWLLRFGEKITHMQRSYGTWCRCTRTNNSNRFPEFPWRLPFLVRRFFASLWKTKRFKISTSAIFFPSCAQLRVLQCSADMIMNYIRTGSTGLPRSKWSVFFNSCYHNWIFSWAICESTKGRFLNVVSCSGSGINS